MGLPHTTVEVEADVPSGRLGAAGGGSASRGGSGSQAAYSTLAAAETAPRREFRFRGQADALERCQFRQ